VAALTRAIKIDASLAGALQQQVNGLLAKCRTAHAQQVC
jgi:hypothetical protein